MPVAFVGRIREINILLTDIGASELVARGSVKEWERRHGFVDLGVGWYNLRALCKLADFYDRVFNVKPSE